MKLAEGLLLRADLQKKIVSLRERIARNAMLQEGTQPLEDPGNLLHEVASVVGEFEDLVVRINTANLTSKLPDGRSLTAAIAARDAAIQRIGILQTAITATRKEPDRYSTREIKWVPSLDVVKLQKQSSDLATRLRELNARIQETNWRVEI